MHASGQQEPLPERHQGVGVDDSGEAGDQRGERLDNDGRSVKSTIQQVVEDSANGVRAVDLNV